MFPVDKVKMEICAGGERGKDRAGLLVSLLTTLLRRHAAYNGTDGNEAFRRLCMR